MPKYHVEYKQIEVRSFELEAPDFKEACRIARELRDQDRLPAGEFSSAFDQELLGLCPVGAEGPIEYFDGEESY